MLSKYGVHGIRGGVDSAQCSAAQLLKSVRACCQLPETQLHCSSRGKMQAYSCVVQIWLRELWVKGGCAGMREADLPYAGVSLAVSKPLVEPSQSQSGIHTQHDALSIGTLLWLASRASNDLHGRMRKHLKTSITKVAVYLCITNHRN